MAVDTPLYAAPAVVAAIVSGIISTAVSLYFVPQNTRRHSREKAERAYQSHVADTVRDFRESVAVMKVILECRQQDAMPVSNHITKLAIPEELLTTKVVRIGDLDEKDRLNAIWMTSILVNINRDVDTLAKLLNERNRSSFYKGIAELQDKMRNLSKAFVDRNPRVTVPAPSNRPKSIQLDNGSIFQGG